MSVLTWWVHMWAGLAPQDLGNVGKFAFAYLMTLLAISLLASALRHFAFSREFDAQDDVSRRVSQHHRQRSRQADSPRVRQIPAGDIQAWSDSALRKLYRWSHIERFFRRLGGNVWVGNLIYPYRIIALFPVLIAFSATVSGWNTNLWRQGWSAMENFGSTLWSSEVKSSLPWILLGMSLILLLPRVPVVDRVRARDEAAKVANSHILKLNAALSDLYYGLARWRETIESERSNCLSGWIVSVFPAGYRQWALELIEGSAGYGETYFRDELKEPDKFTSAYEAMLRFRESLGESGVDAIVWSMLQEYDPFLDCIGVPWWTYPRPTDLESKLHPLNAINSILEQRAKSVRSLLSQPAGSQRSIGVERCKEWSSLDEWQLRELREIVAGVAAELDHALADLILAEHSAYYVSTALRRRIMGGVLLRFASLFQK